MNYLLRHLQVFFYTLGQLVRSPFASLMTISVIGITLALPATLYLLVDNIQRVTAGWDGEAQISLFLKKNVAASGARFLQQRLLRMPEVKHVEWIPPEQGLAELRKISGFAGALKVLDDNPLPGVLVVVPKKSYATPDGLKPLLQKLDKLSEVDLAKIDLEWVQRLQAMLQIIRRGVLVLAGLLALAVILIIGNTIRLAILNRRDEIEITKLIGATNAFVRRPFLYSGFLQGLLGAIMAWLLVTAILLLLDGPIQELTSLYGSRFRVQGLNLATSGLLLLGGGTLGWLGSRLSVGRHLRNIEPQ